MNSGRLPIRTNTDTFRGTFVFGVHPSCYDDMGRRLAERRIRNTELGYLRECFSADHFLMRIAKGKRGDESVSIYIGNLVFKSYPAKDGRGFLLKYVFSENSRDVVDEIQSGVVLQASGGTVLNVTLKDARIFEHYRNGVSIDGDSAKAISCDTEKVMEMLRCKAETFEERRKKLAAEDHAQVDTKERQTVSLEFEEYLNLAESYAAYEDEAAQRDAQSVPPLGCSHPQPAEDYARIDRTAYTYNVEGEFDDKAYTQNAKVVVTLNNEKEASATLVSIGDDHRTVTLLFDDQLDVNDLPELVQVSLSYSSVMYDVQKAVIDDLRRNRTRARFLDDCIGLGKPAPYVKEPLVELEESINRSNKYPPTASQMDAIKRGVSCRDMLLVQGPPGTGKTTVILEWVKYFCIEKKCRVLVSSQNNKAVDNVLERLLDVEGIEAIRAGNEAKVDPKLKDLLLENRVRQYREQAKKQIDANLMRISESLDTLHSMAHSYQELMEASGILDRLKGEHAKNKALVEGGIRGASAEYGRTSGILIKKSERQKQRLIRYADKRDAASFRLLKLIYNFLAGRSFRGYEKTYSRLQETENAYKKQLYEMAVRLCSAKPFESAAKVREQEAAVRGLVEEITYHARKEKEGSPEDTADALTGLPEELFSIPSDVSSQGIQEKLGALRAETARMEQKKQIVSEWSDIIFRQNNYALSDALLESVNLVGGTCIGINSQKKFADINFDVTIIDEAGQIQIHNALVPMSRSPKLLMLGDHKQIPPVANDYAVERCEEDDVDPALEKISLFENLFGRLPADNKVLLDTQFRMPKEIADVLSDWFYEGKYLSSPIKAGMKPLFPELFSSCFVIVDTGKAPGHQETKLAQGYNNRYEADLSSRLVEYMLASGRVSVDEIGIISPYSGQIGLLKSKLSRIPAVGGAAPRIAATLDSFQGQERDVIIYCGTRSNRQGRIGFLSELRRLNVALSRPKKTLVFIGDMPFLQHCRDDDFSAFMQKMTQSVRAGNGDYMDSAVLLKKLAEAG